MKNKGLPNQKKIFLATLIICFLCYGIVYYTGGTALPYPHLFYFPIILAAQFGSWKIVLFTSLLSSLFMSYWGMPLNVAEGIKQAHFSWIFRSSMYITMSIVVKLNTDKIRRRNQMFINKSKNLMAIQRSAFIGILNMAEFRDSETTGKHLERLSYYAEVLLRDMDTPKKLKENIAFYIGFHDIGKVAIPDSILLKPGKLTTKEFERIKEHTTIGGKIIENIEKSIPTDEKETQEMIKLAKEIAFYHHERPDGKGYPYGLKGESIPFAARITSLCDVYDALTSERPYKKAMGHLEAVEIIKAGRGTQFDAQIVDVFLSKHNEFKDIYENFKHKSNVNMVG